MPRLKDLWQRLPIGQRAGAAALSLCVLGAASYGGYTVVDHVLHKPCRRDSGTDVTHRGANGACIGITDGSYAFDPSLRGVEQEVLRENRRVVKEYPHAYVSVVLLLPISADKGSIMSMANAVEQVRGAYTAQRYANANNVEGISPHIRLLIGTDGYQAEDWSAAVSTIEHASSQHIAAVTGLGLSLDGTVRAAKALAARDIPVFGATITADTFDNIKNLVRVSPSNQENTAAALSYIQRDFTRAVLVEDGNTDDSYDRTLVKGFRKFKEIPGHQIVGVEPFDTSKRQHAESAAERKEAEDEIATRISQMPGDICVEQQQKPAVVLFAGRGEDLGVLLHALSNTCLDRPIRIISGDDVTNLPNSAQLRRDLAGHVTVEYAGVAHPDEWKVPAGPRTAALSAQGAQGFATFNGQFQRLFPGAELTDGNTMMAYDATLTAVSAIRLANAPQPRAEAVANELGALQGVHKVLGASGPIQFTANYQTSHTGSDPVDKATPVLRLAADGNTRVRTVIWPPQAPPVS